jgi:hypothetical protein
MAEQRVRVSRGGNFVALDNVINDADYKGVVQTTWLEPQTAIDVGEAMAAIGRAILAEAKP